MAYVNADSFLTRFDDLEKRMKKLETGVGDLADGLTAFHAQQDSINKTLDERMKKLEATVVLDLLKTSKRFAELEHKLLDVVEKLGKTEFDLKGFLDICAERTDLLSSDDEELTTSGSAASTGTA